MKRLVAICAIVTTVLAIGSTALAGLTWQLDPILGYDSSYNGNIIIVTTTGTVVVPYDDPGYPPYTTGTSMSVFTVGQAVHTGSWVNMDSSESYTWSAAFVDLTDLSRSISYSGTVDSSEGYWFTWNTPTGDGDGLGLATLTTEDIGNWVYVETYTDSANIATSRTVSFTVVPEPTTICLLGIGVLSMVRRKKLA